MARSTSKTDLRYWRETIYRPKNQSGAKIQQFYVKIQFQGRRETFPLKSNNQDEAADKAKRLYLGLVAKGWEAVLAEEKPQKKEANKAAIVTVGDLIQVSLQRNDIRKRTVVDYTKALRLLVAQCLGMGQTVREASRQEILRRKTKIDNTPLSKITSKEIQNWKQRSLGKATLQGPLVLRQVKTTINSVLRKAKSLFSPKFVRHIDLGISFQNPFDGIDFEPRQSSRYNSQIDLPDLIKAALQGDTQREITALPLDELKAFLLAGLGGLRRNEIDKLEWVFFQWDQNIIRLTTTEFFQPKTEESLGDINVDPELMTLFKDFYAKSTSRFVIDSTVAPRLNAGYAHYRCDKIFNRLTAWLKKAGVSGQKPLHTLRKEFGSVMCSKHGIYAASRALRHRDIYITSQHYLDSKQRLTPGLGISLVKG